MKEGKKCKHCGEKIGKYYKHISCDALFKALNEIDIDTENTITLTGTNT